MPRFLLALSLGLLARTATAQDLTQDTKALSHVLREMLIANAPTPLVETEHNWGQQREVIIGMKLHRAGRLRWEREPIKEMRNDGHWHKLRVNIPNPQQSVSLALENMNSPEKGKITFIANIGADVDLGFEHQLWKSGIRLYSGETRGRCKAAVKLECEVRNELRSKPGSLLPDVVLNFKVNKADLFYTDLVFDHTLGLGGDAAKILGETGHTLLTRVKPSLERDLIAKANAAIVKAADSKEVKLELTKLLGQTK